MGILVNNQIVESFEFPGGECQIRVPIQKYSDITKITAQLFNANDIMRLLLTVDAIRRIQPQTSIELTIPYFPYARQDRVCNEGEALSVKVMANLINDLHCQKLIVIDPHSDVTPALLNNVQIVSMAEIIIATEITKLIQANKLALLSPDAGAEKKVRNVGKLLTGLGINVDVFNATKNRNTLTGEITATNVHDEVAGRSIIILDDICDGGRTFIELSRLLKEKGAKDIYLYVTHGIFSHGLDVLREHFSHIYCYHTMLESQQIDPLFLTIVSHP